MAEVPPDVELNSQPLKYTTWVLKVSIHCEGCKRKVKRILHSVEGVYTIDVEKRQHKVVVTGNVDANTLIRKLEKSGKHAELWPHRNNIFYHNDEQQQQQQQNENDHNQDQNQPDQQQQQPPDNSCQQQQQQQQQQNVVKEVRFATNVTSPGNDISGGGPGAPGAPKKKKKKKKSNSSGNTNVNNTVNNNGPESQQQHEQQQQEQQQQQQQHCNNNGPPHPESQQQQCMGSGPGVGMGQVNMGPQGGMQSNRVYEYAPVYHAPQPMCGVSYNTAYPRSYTASYYSTRSPYSHSYAYTRGGDVEMAMPLDLTGVSSLQPQESFELFSDENPNACSVM